MPSGCLAVPSHRRGLLPHCRTELPETHAGGRAAAHRVCCSAATDAACSLHPACIPLAGWCRCAMATQAHHLPTSPSCGVIPCQAFTVAPFLQEAPPCSSPAALLLAPHAPPCPAVQPLLPAYAACLRYNRFCPCTLPAPQYNRSYFVSWDALWVAADVLLTSMGVAPMAGVESEKHIATFLSHWQEGGQLLGSVGPAPDVLPVHRPCGLRPVAGTAWGWRHLPGACRPRGLLANTPVRRCMPCGHKGCSLRCSPPRPRRRGQRHHLHPPGTGLV